MRTATRGHWLAAVALVAVLLCLRSAYADDVNFRYIPVLNVVTLTASDGGCQYVSDQLCRASGAFIPGDVTGAIHDKIAEVAGAARSGTWYGFLGADTIVDDLYSIQRNLTLGLPECYRGLGDPFTATSIIGQPSSNRLATQGCIWRWRSGRWFDMTDIQYDSLPGQLATSNIHARTAGYGVAFAYGNRYDFYGALDSEFVSYFSYTANANLGGVAASAVPCDNATVCAMRPGNAAGRQLMSVGNGAAFTWSDGSQTGGYIYDRLATSYEAAATVNAVIPGTTEVNAASSDLIAKHLTVCMLYNPGRFDKELWNTSSQLQNLWWVIYFVILFVICLVIFIVAVCCQEREDMDEPPEDAPEWADNEVNDTRKPKRVVSQHSFRQQPDDDVYSDNDKYADADDSYNGNPLNENGGSGRVTWQ